MRSTAADDEPAALNVARQLTSDDVDAATWRWLAPLTINDLERWTGPCARGVLDSLIEVTGGQGGYTAALWRDWRQRGIVDDMCDARWRFSHGHIRLFDDLDEVVDERVRRFVGDNLGAITRASRLLACAALEGRRFTAHAIAAALGRDVDETINFLDDVLIADADHRDGFVIAEGFLTVSDERGTRNLATYSFVRELDWMTMAHHGLSDVEQHHLALRLGVALEGLYGGEAHRVADTLRRLFSVAADPQRAAHYQRMVDNGLNRAVVLWRAQNVLAEDDPVDSAERHRACMLLVAAADELLNVGPFHDGLVFAIAAHRLAERRSEHARALYLTASHLIPQGAYERARAELTGARHLYRELHDRSGEADARAVLAAIDQEQGDYERARAEYTAVLAIRRELGDRSGEGHALLALGSIDELQGEYQRARTRWSAALKIHRALGDSHCEAHARYTLAGIDLRQCEYERARTEFTAVLEMRREL